MIKKFGLDFDLTPEVEAELGRNGLTDGESRYIWWLMAFQASQSLLHSNVAEGELREVLRDRGSRIDHLRSGGLRGTPMAVAHRMRTPGTFLKSVSLVINSTPSARAAAKTRESAIGKENSKLRSAARRARL